MLVETLLYLLATLQSPDPERAHSKCLRPPQVKNIFLNYLYIILTRASITYHTCIWTQEPGSRIQDLTDSEDSVDSYEAVRGQIVG